MEMDAAKLIGAGLAVIALAGVGVGIGNIFASLVNAPIRRMMPCVLQLRRRRPGSCGWKRPCLIEIWRITPR